MPRIAPRRSKFMLQIYKQFFYYQSYFFLFIVFIHQSFVFFPCFNAFFYQCPCKSSFCSIFIIFKFDNYHSITSKSLYWLKAKTGTVIITTPVWQLYGNKKSIPYCCKLNPHYFCVWVLAYNVNFSVFFL